MNTPEPQPTYFGPEGAGLFGWLHRPAAGSRAGFGFVICNPFGFEEVCAHRSLRHLAQAAAAAGIPALRFDYAGCGNAEGDEFAPDLVARWTRSVHAAIDHLQRATGLTQVCLLGVRLGATLATLAALERDDIAGLVALAPVLRGRAYLRELTLLGAAGAAPADADATAGNGLIESAGFVMTRTTGEALAAIDLRGIDRPPAPRVLVVERDDLPAPPDWPATLERLGADVTRARWSGYAGMMADPQRTVVPDAIIGGVLGQLQAWQGTGALQAVADHAAGAPARRFRADGTANAPCLIETAVRIDTGVSHLAAILTTAEAGPAAQARGPAVLMLNSGSVHLIGPNRLWVRLARRWAAQGVTVLRLDLSGIGDSPVRPGAAENVVYSAHAAADIERALAFLKTQAGGGDHHLLGLCSGAYHAFKAAVAGQPVASILMINPLTYFWRDGTVLSDVKEYEIFELTTKYRGKLFTREPWLRLLRGQLDLRLIAEVMLRRLGNLVTPALLAVARLLRWPIDEDLAAELGAAARRGARLRFVFAARAPGFALLRKQSGRAMSALTRRGQASVDFVAGADHTFTGLAARERLVALLDRLLLPRLGSQPGGSGAVPPA